MVAESGGGGWGWATAAMQSYMGAMYSTQKYPHSGLDQGSFKYLAPETEAARGPDSKQWRKWGEDGGCYLHVGMAKASFGQRCRAGLEKQRAELLN